ncbi:MAG: RelA/SpoT protein [Alphaproteobacteria bacterium]|nr:RelA/SpoT protein [Alphaproteobacteria bacterium]
MAKKKIATNINDLSREAYEAKTSTLEALREEAVFILNEAVTAKSIKIHAVESRVKEYESFRRKVQGKAGGSDYEIDDLVGARVVCLFKSDLDSIGKLIEKEFKIVATDDKVSGADDSFGYMSVHYIVVMKSSYTGPRYNKIKGMKFEIQVRTLCMHAWAAISHYLDYKAEWDIPTHLRKGLNALSGLFYVADEQYERLYDARQASRVTAGSSVARSGTTSTPINLDTVTAFLQRKFPDRVQAASPSVSTLVRELIESDYRSIEQVEDDIESARDKLNEDEAGTKKAQKVTRKLFYNSAGVVRVSLKLVNPKFEEVMKRTLEATKKTPAEPFVVPGALKP